MKLEDYKAQQRLNILEYGESGTGKSIRAASAASLWGPAYLFDFDRKIASVFEFYKERPQVLRSLEYDTYTNCEEAFSKLREIDAGMTKTGKVPYATLIWDSWTAWEDLVLSKIIEDNPGKDRKRVFLDAEKAKPRTEREIVEVPTLEDYGIHSSVQSRFILELTALPMNLIVIAHVQSKKDEVTGATESGIQAVGKLWKVLPKFFGEVHRCFVERGEYRVQVQANPMFTAKTVLKGVPKNGILSGDLSHFNAQAFAKQEELSKQNFNEAAA